MWTLSNILRSAKTAAARAALATAALYRKYPARCNSYILAALVASGSAVGLVVDRESAGQVIAVVVPILLGGEATHRLVTPAK